LGVIPEIVVRLYVAVVALVLLYMLVALTRGDDADECN
jgi:hypothetical protein